MIDPQQLYLWLSIASVTISIATVIITWWRSGEKEQAKKLIDHDRRIQRIEDEMKHLPSKDMVMDLKLSMADMKGTVGTLTETMASISRTVHRIDDYLREAAK